MMETKRLSRKSARRRVRTRTALFLYAFSLAGMLVTSLLSAMVSPALRVWLGAAGTLLFFALPAYLGFAVMDGDQRHLLPDRKLSGAQMLWLLASGALLICPATLLGDMETALLRMLGVGTASVPGTGSAAMLLPLLFVSGVLAPVCEELFFRGYLLSVFSRRGETEAALLTAACFAAVHGLDGFLLYFLLGLLFAAAALHTGSVLAPVALHMAYNVMLIVLSATPLSALFTGLTLLSSIVRLCGCAALFYTAKRMWRARGVRQAQEGLPQWTIRELLVCLAALLLVLVSHIMTGVMGL